MTDRLLTAREVAELLGVGPATVLRWTRQGEMSAVRLPSGQVRSRSEEIDAWLAGRATPGPDWMKRRNETTDDELRS